MLTVWAVEWGNEFPAEVDSLWTTEVEAKKKARELNERAPALGGRWSAEPWVVRDLAEPE